MRRVAGLDWRLALLIAVCFVLAAMAVTSSRQSPTEHERPRIQAQQEPKGGLKSEKPSESVGQAAGDRTPRTDQIPSGIPSGKGKDQAEQANDEGAEYWPSIFSKRVKITDSLLVIFTAALVYYTSKLNESTLKLWASGEKQIDAAKQSADAAVRSTAIAQEALIYDQRAWVQAEIFILSGIEYQDGRAVITIGITFKNIGKSPALFVWCFPRLNAPTNDRRTDDVLTREVESLVKMSFGFNLLPGESASENFNVELSRDDIETGGFGRSTRSGLERPGNPTHMAIDLIGIVTYQNALTGKDHATTFVYNIATPDGLGTFPRFGPDVPIEQLRLRPVLTSKAVIS